MKTKNVLALIGAVAVGAAVAVYLTSDKDSELRKKVKRKTADAAEAMGDLLEKGREEYRKYKENAGNGGEKTV